jgi:hypothetical protein
LTYILRPSILQFTASEAGKLAYFEMDEETSRGIANPTSITYCHVCVEGFHHGVQILVVKVLHHRVDDAHIPHLAKHNIYKTSILNTSLKF